MKYGLFNTKVFLSAVDFGLIPASDGIYYIAEKFGDIYITFFIEGVGNVRNKKIVEICHISEARGVDMLPKVRNLIKKYSSIEEIMEEYLEVFL